MQEVRTAYTYLKKKYADISHIICAYKLADKTEILSNDCEDEGDHGAGRCLHKVLNSRGFANKALFLVIRNFGGIKLFKRRYKLFELVANQAIDLTLQNEREGAYKRQNIHDTPQQSRSTMAIRGRSAYRGIHRFFEHKRPLETSSINYATDSQDDEEEDKSMDTETSKEDVKLVW